MILNMKYITYRARLTFFIALEQKSLSLQENVELKIPLLILLVDLLLLQLHSAAAYTYTMRSIALLKEFYVNWTVF